MIGTWLARLFAVAFLVAFVAAIVWATWPLFVAMLAALAFLVGLSLSVEAIVAWATGRTMREVSDEWKANRLPY